MGVIVLVEGRVDGSQTLRTSLSSGILAAANDVVSDK